MEDYNRSKSYGGSRTMQMDNHYGPPRAPPTSYELRSYSTSYAQTQMGNYNYNNRDLKKGKSVSKSSSWALADPELQRKKRVASYKMYSVEGKMKGSFRKSFRWLKTKTQWSVVLWHPERSPIEVVKNLDLLKYEVEAYKLLDEKQYSVPYM